MIPPGADIREALLAFQTGQVVGFYNPADGELVYLSGGDVLGSLTERVILAHELTHAIDDQHFDLTRIDDIVATCDDEAFQSALGAVEGSAQHFAFAVAARFPGGTIDPGRTADSPPACRRSSRSSSSGPTRLGRRSSTRWKRRGGVKAVNGAIETFPLSTEQVMHSERYPNDVPQPVDVPDLSAALGDGWRDLDVMTVGEAWLQTMLRLRLDNGTADAAAAGWDGGTYRAWTDGDAVAVAMTTVWDSGADAHAFADAARTWIEDGEYAGVRHPGRERIRHGRLRDGRGHARRSRGRPRRLAIVKNDSIAVITGAGPRPRTSSGRRSCGCGSAGIGWPVRRSRRRRYTPWLLEG